MSVLLRRCSPAECFQREVCRHLLASHHSELAQHLRQKYVPAINPLLFTFQSATDQGRGCGAVNKIDDHHFVIQSLNSEWHFVTVTTDRCSVDHDVITMCGE